MTDEILQTLEIPLEESKRGVFSAYLNLILSCANIIANTSNETDNRTNEIVDIMISVIPNLDKQKSLREQRDKRIETEIVGLTTNEEKGRKIKQINREILGEISAYMDIYQGGERKNRLSFIIPQKEMRELMMKNNPLHFEEYI